MLPKIPIFGLSVPSYGLCALIGLAFASVMIYFSLKGRKDYSKTHLVFMILWAIGGALVGSRLVYMITRVDVFVFTAQKGINIFESFETFSEFITLILGGMVFYGGLLGALIAVKLYTMKAKVDFDVYADAFAPAIPLFHAFGRIGCLLGGCCYGIEASWGVPYTHIAHDGSEIIINRLPLPLIEACCNILIMAALLLLRRRGFKKGSILAFYFVFYAAVRFTDEFFRGDEIRGKLLGLSTSQWISIGVMIVGIYMLLNRYVLKNKDRFGYNVKKGEIPQGCAYHKYQGVIYPSELEKYKLLLEKPEAEFPSSTQQE